MRAPLSHPHPTLTRGNPWFPHGPSFRMAGSPSRSGESAVSPPPPDAEISMRRFLAAAPPRLANPPETDVQARGGYRSTIYPAASRISSQTPSTCSAEVAAFPIATLIA